MSQPGFSESSAAEQQHMGAQGRGWPLWPLVFVFVALMLVLIARWGFAPQPELTGERHPSVGQKLTTFRLQPLTGESRATTEADLADKVSLVNYWGPWCGVCAVEFPHLVELVHHFRERPNFQFFSVSSNSNPHDDRDLAANTAEFLREFKADFSTYRDPDGETATALMESAQLGSFAFPTTLVIGPGGVIRALWVGYVPGDEKAVRRAIEKALLDAGK